MHAIAGHYIIIYTSTPSGTDAALTDVDLAAWPGDDPASGDVAGCWAGMGGLRRHVAGARGDTPLAARRDEMGRL